MSIKKFEQFSQVCLMSGGGLDIPGSKALGLRTTGIVEIEKFAYSTYLANTDLEVPYTVLDIKDSRYHEYKEAVNLYNQNLHNAPHFVQRDADIFKIDLNRIYIVKATPDCHDFTTANKKRNTKSKKAQLIYKCLDFIESARPYHLFIENVPGFKSAIDHNDESYVRLIVKRLKNMGYQLVHGIHSARDYQEAQHRRRYIIIGSLLKKPYIPRPITPRINYGNIFAEVNKYRDTGDSYSAPETLEKLVGKPIGIWFKKDNNETTRATWYVANPYGMGQIYSIMWLDKYYMFRATKYFKPQHVINGKIVKAIDDNDNPIWRRFSIPESLSLFSVNHEFKFPNVTKFIYKKTKKTDIEPKKMKVRLDKNKQEQQRIIGNGLCSMFYYHMMKQFLDKNLIKRFEINFAKKMMKQRTLTEF